MSAYTELRCRSAFSFLTGASQPEELVDRAAALDYPALALGDRDGLSGAPRFHKAAAAAGLRALVGADLMLEDGSTLYLLVESRAGYRHLCRLITQAKLRAPKGQSAVRWSDLEEHARGLVCLAGGDRSPVTRALAGRPDGAARIVHRLLGILGRERVAHKRLDAAFAWIAAQQHQRDAARLANPKLTGRQKGRLRPGAPIRTPAPPPA
jgi:error-prone DNA polymerase